jgi:hypothetical protein
MTTPYLPICVSSRESSSGDPEVVNEVPNDWERRYDSAVACPVCRRSDMHASDCPVGRRKAHIARRFGVPLAAIGFGVAVWQGAVGNAVVAVVAGAAGCALAAAVATRYRTEH